MRVHRLTVTVVAACLLLPIPNVWAQNVGAGRALNDLLTGGATFEDQTAAFIGLLQEETTTFPLGSAAGGFTWLFNPDLGVWTRRSSSFGPMFAERPFTNGKGRLNVGLAFQHTRWESVAGQPLGGLALTFSETCGAAATGCLLAPPGTTLSATFSSELDVTTDRTTITATYGVTGRADVGVVVPFGRTRVAGVARSRATLGPAVSDESTAREGSSSGIGDVVLRGKATVLARSSFDLAAAVDLRLPTGDDRNLLGAGTTQIKAMALGAHRIGIVSPHFNIGYTFGGDGIAIADDTATANPSPEFDYTVGAEVVPHVAVTIMADIVGRSLRKSATFAYRSFTDASGSGTTLDAVRFSGLEVTPGRLTLLLGTVGAKVKVAGNWLATAAILFPLDDNGIKPGVTPVVGFERAF